MLSLRACTASASVLLSSTKPLFSRHTFQQLSSSFKKMSHERKRAAHWIWRAKPSPSQPKSHLSRESVGESMLLEDGPSSASSNVCASKCSSIGGPPLGQMLQGRAAGIEKNGRGTEHKCSNDAIQFNHGSPVGGTQQGEVFPDVSSDKALPCSECSETFDICPDRQKGPVKLKPPLFEKNKEKRREHEASQPVELRPGMILMKKYISQKDQVKIIKECRSLGIGSGGFYQPGYSDGTKLHLWMMCLGKNWDPQTRFYGDKRPLDGAVPPVIPDGFSKLVERAIQDSHAFLNWNSKVRPVEAVLPNMTPDICIVNFYTSSGKLGLHQDRDESHESRARGLPVVSFSIGDSAEFLYGDDRDEVGAEKVLLQSGDVLIFGGKSRLIYHGVPYICPNTAPKLLVDETNLRSGRLNLTFRQY